MRVFGYMTGLVLGVLLMAGCSNTVDTAGIEIGNPELANNDTIPDTMQSLAFKAGFSIDYSDLNPVEEREMSALLRSSPLARSASKRSHTSWTRRDSR